MSIDNTEPNSYFRLAVIYERVYKTADPLTDFEMVMANANEAELRFLQANRYVDAKDVSKNNEFYYPYFPNSFDAKGRPAVEYGVVANRLKNGMDSAKLIKQKLPAIYHNFTKSVNSYDQAVKIFASLCDQYESLEDLYLLFNEDVDARLTQLKSAYDSTIIYFDKYKTLIQDYPIRYKQSYTIKPIETFRLDGFITRLNFLTPNVDLWNYGAWVDAVRQSTSTRIKEIRAKLNDAESRLQASLSKLNSGDIQDFKPVSLDKELVLELNNVDKESAVLALLRYQDYLQTWLFETKRFKVDTAVAERNAVAYSNFLHENRHADTLIHELADRITDQKITMHKDFIAQYFGSKALLEKYTTDQSAMISKTYQDYAANLRSTILQIPDSSQFMLFTKTNSVRFGYKTIPLRVLPIKQEDLDKGLLFTQFNQKNPDGSAYIAGIHKPDKKVNNTVVFVARVNPDGKVAWLNSFSPNIDSTSKVADANQILGPAIVTPEGIAFIVQSQQLSSGSKMNTFFYLNEKGEARVKFTLVDSSFPRFLKYRENLNAFVFILKGMEQQPNINAKEDVTLMCVNVLKDVMWRKSFPLSGTIVDAVEVSDGLVLAGNFMIMNDARGNEVRTKVNSQECNPFLVTVGDKGEIRSMPISIPFSFYLNKIFRVSDQSINLIGSRDSFESGMSKRFDYNSPVLHIMATKFGQIAYKNY